MAHKLLLADDSVTIQRVIELTFADEPIEVIAVGDGEQAIARIEADRPDVVLADAGMPEKDGYTVAAYVKSRAHLKHIPVLLLTGAFEPVDEARARAAGCDGVLVKPFEPQVVIARVRDLLAGRRPPGLWAAPPPQPVQATDRPAPPPPEEEPAAGARVDYKALAGATETAEPAVRPASPPAESLEEYFDRLDAAFASLGVEEPAAEAGPPAAPELGAPLAAVERGVPSGDRGRAAARPEDAPTAVLTRPGPAGGPPSPTVAPPAAATPAATPSLSEAFASLLAAEQAQAGAAPPAVSGAPAPVAITDEVIDTIVGRVVERVTSQAVRDTVLEVAERLVREEIARIKSATR